MNLKNTCYFVLCLFLFGFSACTSGSTPATADGRLPRQPEQEYYKPDAVLPIKSNWVLESINRQQLGEARIRGEVPTLQLDLEEGKARGNAGCNNYNTSVIIGENNKITFGHILRTKVTCQSQPLENAFLEILDFGLLNYSYTPEKLTIQRDVRSILEFRRVD